MENDKIDGLVRRTGNFMQSAGLSTRPAPVEMGSKVLNVNASTVATYSNRVVLGSVVVGWGSWLVDGIGQTNLLVPAAEIASVGLVGGIGASLVASAPATPHTPTNPLRLRSQNLRRAMIGGAALGAAGNWATSMAGVGGHHTAIGLAAAAVAAAGYLGGL